MSQQLPQEGERWNWKYDKATKLTFMGTYRYGGDPRTWYKFAKVEKPNECWCEVLSEDLRMLEKSNA